MKPNAKKKKILLISLLAVLLAAIFLLTAVLGRKKTPVAVERASNWMLGWMPNQMQLYGNISSDRSQQILYDKDMTVLEILVKEGDTVKVGDPLLRYDATLDTIDLELKALEMQKLQYELDDYYKAYKKYARKEYPRTIPSPTPTPSPTPRPTRTPKPTKTPRPTATPRQEAFSGADKTGGRVFRISGIPQLLRQVFSTVPTVDIEIFSDEKAFSAGDLIGYLRQSLQKGTPYTVRVTGTNHVLLLTCSMSENIALTPASIDYDSSALLTASGSGTGNDPYVLSDFAPSGLVRGIGASLIGAVLSEAADAPVFLRLTGNGILVELSVTDTSKPTPSPTPEATPTPTPTPSPTPTPTASPSPTPSASPESGGGDSGGGSSGGSGMSREEREALAKQYAKKIRDAELEYKQLKLDLQNLHLRGADGYLRAEIDGVVSLAEDPTTLSDGDRMIAIKGSEGFYVRCIVGELDLERVPVGTELSGFCYENGQSCSGKVVEVGTVPITQNYYSGGNSNVSGYAIRIFIEDGQGLQAGQYVEFTLDGSADSENTTESTGVYLYEAYVREIDGLHYIFAARDGILRQEQVERGRMQYSYVELIGSTLTDTDYIAFPYGKDVKDGAPVLLPEDAEISE